MNQQVISNLPPNDALKVFGPVIGVWDIVGTHGMIPNTILHGRTSFDWHESGAFLRMDSCIQEDVGIPVGLAVIGSDDELGTYVMSYYDERGVSRTYHVSMQDNVMRWWRDAPGFSQRYSLAISEDGETLLGKGELSRDGSTWEKDLDLTYRKVKP